jgi:hypothetical protein
MNGEPIAKPPCFLTFANIILATSRRKLPPRSYRRSQTIHSDCLPDCTRSAFIQVREPLGKPLCALDGCSAFRWYRESLDCALFEQYRHDIESIFISIVDIRAGVKAKEDVA